MYAESFYKEFSIRVSGLKIGELVWVLEIDDNNLYNFYNGLDTDIKFENNKINNLFKNFLFNNNSDASSLAKISFPIPLGPFIIIP